MTGNKTIALTVNFRKYSHNSLERRAGAYRSSGIKTPCIIQVIKPRITWAGNATPTWTGEVHVVFWCSDLREKYHLEELSVAGIIILKWICKKFDRGARAELVWLRMGTNDSNLWMQRWTFGFHKTWEISWLFQYLLSSEEGLCSFGLVSWLVSAYLSDTMNQLLRLHGMLTNNKL